MEKRGKREMKLMKQNGFRWILSLGVTLMLGSASANAEGSRTCTLPGGGDGIPTPLNLTSNARVELASGEQYTLVGVARNFGGTIYLEVDFEEHPWLATKQRLGNPFYKIASQRLSLKQWAPFLNHKVVVDTQAHGVVQIRTAQRTPFYSMELALLRNPELYSEYMDRAQRSGK